MGWALHSTAAGRGVTPPGLYRPLALPPHSARPFAASRPIQLPLHHNCCVPNLMPPAGEISGVCLNPSADMDAGQAAAQRAACRRNQLLAAFEEGTGVRQGDDVEGEEDYEDPEEM